MSQGPWKNYVYSGGTGARHWRVRKIRGRASDHPCEGCPSVARDWATVHGRDGLNPLTDYIALCRSCHRFYDSVRPTHSRPTCKNGHSYELAGSYINKEGVRICRECDRQKTARRKTRLVSVS